MRTIAISNLKGGVGKTTTTFNLGAALAELGHTVLMIDADPQGSLTDCLGIRSLGSRNTLADVLRGQATVGTAAVSTSIPGVWAVRSSPLLDDINRRNLAGERVLLARLPATCDYTLIDCPPGNGVVLHNAYVAADQVLCPVPAKGMASQGVARMIRLVRDMRERGSNSYLDVLGIVVNQFDRRTRIGNEVVGRMRSEYGELVLDTIINESVLLAEAADAQLPIHRYAPATRAASDIRSLTREVIRRAITRDGYFGPAPAQRNGNGNGLAVVNGSPGGQAGYIGV